MSIPDRIWLQWHGDADPAHYPNAPDPAAEEVTWCWHQVHEHDVAYVRADQFDALRAERDALRAALIAMRDSGPNGSTHFKGWHQTYAHAVSLALAALEIGETK